MIKAPHRIDVHHHIVPPEYVRALAGIGITNSIGASFPRWDAETALGVMDRNGIETAITSISCPGVFFGDTAFAARLARQCNEASARLITDYPGRFGAFATLPLPDAGAALKEFEYSLEALKLDGVVLLTNYSGTYLGDPAFEDVFCELNRRKTPVFVHPTDPPGSNPLGMHIPNFLFEVAFDTTRAIVNLIFSGTLQRYPDIPFIFAHAGGAAPYLAWRIALGSFVIPNALEKAPKDAISYLKCLNYDTALAASPFAMRSIKELVDATHILFGSDYPFAPEIITGLTVSGLQSFEGFSGEELLAVEKGNAARMFP